MNVSIGVFLLLYIIWGVDKNQKLLSAVLRRNAKPHTVKFYVSSTTSALNILLYDPFPRVPVCAAVAYAVNLLLGGSLTPWQS